MSYDVIVTETVGENSKEYKFKDYQNFLDWELQRNVVNKMEVKDGFVRLTKENVHDLVKAGDTVIIKDSSPCNRYDFSLNTEYLVTVIDLSDKFLPIKLNGFSKDKWVSFRDPELEIYKVIKN